MRVLLQSFLLLCFAASMVGSSVAETVSSATEDMANDRIEVLIDCDWCDQDYLRQEIDYVNHVRNRQEAQVHVMATSQHSGSGGRVYTVTFTGREEFASMTDTLMASVYQDDSQDEARDKLKHVIELGLIRFLARTSLADCYELKIAKREDGEEAALEEDPWNNWVFRISANGWSNGSKSFSSTSFWNSISANRVTEEWKFTIMGSFDYRESVYKLSSSEEKSVTRSRHAFLQLVKSLGEHWSAGATGATATSLFDNYDLTLGFYPAIEYDVFPYSESARRSLTLQYKIGASYYDYDQETIYDKTKETLWSQSVEIDLDLVRDWGSVNLGLEGSHYLHDFDLNHLDADGSVNLKLVKGLSMNFWGIYSAIHDQINLSKYDASDEDIMLQRRELESQYNYYMSVGLSYSFGSIYNNVVNPRF